MVLPERERWNQLSSLLDELMDLSGYAQQLRLAQLREQDEDLHDEVLALLHSSDRAEETHFLSAGPNTFDGSDSTLVGRQVGAYVIESRLGEGATGSVWCARRADGRFEGRVAIKLLHLSLVGRVGALRFEREGAILARLVHPNIAQLLDAGITSGGQPYLVLEFVAGKRIDCYCNDERLNIEQRLALFSAVLAAVAHAHSHLVIHRDVKPSNILVSTDGRVKLLDFGIAKLIEEGDQSASITVDGQRVLTPQYAAPEQLQGGSITTATDVYALGVLLFQLLTGSHPLTADTATSSEVVRATLESDPLRLVAALSEPARLGSIDPVDIAAQRGTPLARLRRQLSGDLENILSRTLRKKAAERYQAVDGLADDLRRYLANEPVSARPDSLRYRAAKFVRRHRATVAAGLIVLSSLGAGLVGTVTQARRAEAQTVLAQQERDRAQRELAAIEAQEEFITFLLSSKSDKPFTTSQLLLRGEALVRKQFADDAGLRARLQLSLSNLTSELDEQERTLALLKEARSSAATTNDSALQSAIDCAIASDVEGLPDAAQAAAMFSAALRRLSTEGNGDRSVRASCLHLRSIRALESDDVQGALIDSRAALEVLGAPRPGQRAMAVFIRGNLAGALAKSGDVAGGIAELQRCVNEFVSLGRGETVAIATLYNNLSVLLARAGNPLAALAAAESAVGVYGDPKGISSAPVPLLRNLALQMLAVGRGKEAEVVYQRARMLANERGDSRNLAYTSAVFSHCPLGQAARCNRQLTEAKGVLAGFLPKQHPVFGSLETTIAETALARGEANLARPALIRALAIFDSSTTPQPMRTRAAALLARAEVSVGNSASAARYSAQAVAQARILAEGFAHSEWLGSALVAQGIAQQALGRVVEARASWEEAVIELEATVGQSAPVTDEARRLLAGL